MKRFRLALALFALLSVTAFGQFGQLFGGAKDDEPGHVQVSLVAEATSVEAGKPFTVALKLDHSNHWHTYWINPGVGQPTQVEWKLPEGWSASELKWPVPKIDRTGGSLNHLYEGTAYLLTDITPPATWAAGSTATLQGDVEWLECLTNGACVPGKGSVSLNVTAAASTAYDATLKKAFDAVRAEQPEKLPAWDISGDDGKRTLTLTLARKDGATTNPGEIYFFERNKALEDGKPQVTETPTGYQLVFTKSDGAKDRATGFLHAPKGWLAGGGGPALAVDVPVTPVPEADEPTAATDAAHGELPYDPKVLDDETLAAMDDIIPATGPKYSGEEPLTFWWALLLAFVGGIILNLMPCVFPVLGLKVLGFVNQAGEDPRKVRLHGVAFGAGLLLSLWVIAAIVISANKGWGFQQQSAGFTAGFCVLIFLLGLNLWGVFEFGTSLTGVGGGLMNKGGYTGSFFTGVLTTLIATPCSGPFLGAAIGFAVKQPPFPAWLLFTSFGLGIAAPYLVLSFKPSLVNLLPRPGAWMETFKKVMAFPMFATVVYFLNTFLAQKGGGHVIDLLFALVLVGLAAWIYGHWCTPFRKKTARLAGGAFAVLSLAGGVWLIKATVDSPGDLDKVSPSYGRLRAEPWSPQRLKELREEGRLVYVDFTAVWCLNCQLNKKRVFLGPGSEEVTKRFQELDVVILKASQDETDKVIDEFLRRHDFSQIPVNFVYPEDGTSIPILLPTFLGPDDVLDALEKAKTPAATASR